MQHWLVKTEPDVYSIDDLQREKKTLWDKVRNYQARNYLRAMQLGDKVLIYHSNSNPSAIVGLGSVSALAIADPTQFDSRSEYFDDKANQDNPRWFSPEIRFVKKFAQPIALEQLRTIPKLAQMTLLQRGSRLSVLPVSGEEFRAIEKLLA